MQGYWESENLHHEYLYVDGNNIFHSDKLNVFFLWENKDEDASYKIGYHEYWKNGESNEDFMGHDTDRERVGIQDINQMNKNNMIHAYVDNEDLKEVIYFIQSAIKDYSSSKIKYLASYECSSEDKDAYNGRALSFVFCENKQKKLITMHYEKIPLADGSSSYAYETIIYRKMSQDDVEKEVNKGKDESIRRMKSKLDFSLKGNYSERDIIKLAGAYNQGCDRTITVAEFDSFPEELKKEFVRSGDAYQFPELRRLSGVSNVNSDNIDNSTQTEKEDYSWIIGMWYLETPYGITGIHFREGGRCTELDDVNNPYSAKYGNYEIRDNNTLAYRIDGEPITTTIEIVGNRLHAGGGYYYKKIRQ